MVQHSYDAIRKGWLPSADGAEWIGGAHPVRKSPIEWQETIYAIMSIAAIVVLLRAAYVVIGFLMRKEVWV